MLLQELGCGSGMTCWPRLYNWQEAGVWDAFHHALLNRLGRAGLIDWSRCSLDAASLPAKAGGEHTGPNPTDRGKSGSKRHIVVERQGIPLAVLLSAANVHDNALLEDLIDRIPPIRKPRGRARRRAIKLCGTDDAAIMASPE
jgi:transposase